MAHFHADWCVGVGRDNRISEVKPPQVNLLDHLSRVIKANLIREPELQISRLIFILGGLGFSSQPL